LTSFINWYVFILILGLINLPLTWRLFKGLPSRGYALSRPLGLLLWGYLFWLLTSLQLLHNDLAGQLVALGLVLVLNLLVLRGGRAKELWAWIKANRRLIFTTETLFLVAFGLWALVRAANPAIIGTEKPMEMAFINAILRSPTFPPNDPWLSGYAISYYYFGYVIAAMLIRVSGVDAAIGYNLMSALWFALTALGAYGILFDLLAGSQHRKTKIPGWVYTASLLAPFMLLIVSNWHGFLDIMHARGLFWSQDAAGQSVSSFWQWINLKELTTAPPSYSWFPLRIGGVQWWGASRVVQDFTLSGAPLEVIDEFPFFTYLLSDLHPHLLAMPFVLLAISQALNAIRGGWEGETRILRWTVPWALPELVLAVLTLGGLAFMNTWDFPFYLLLIAAALAYGQYLRYGWSGRRVGEFFLLCFGLGISAILLYFPFFVSFSSQAGGILPSLAFFTQGHYFWIMFGPLLLPLFAGLLAHFFARPQERAVKPAFFMTLGLFLFLFVFSWGLAFIGTKLPNLNELFLGLQGATPGINPLWQALVNRLKAPGTWITLFLLCFLALNALLGKYQARAEQPESADGDSPTHTFVLFMLILGLLLTLAPEFVYLRDNFGTRMNTIFKFYFQAWILWSLAGSYMLIQLLRSSGKSELWEKLFSGIMLLLGVIAMYLGLYRDDPIFQRFNQNLGTLGSSPLDYIVLGIFALGIIWFILELVSRRWKMALAVVCICGIAMGLVYPIVALWNKTGGIPSADQLTLDGAQYYKLVWPDQMQAVEWLKQAPLGVMVEAVADTGGSYTTYASVSTFSGMPTVLGWIGHEAQWRGGYLEMGSRQNDIRTLYRTHDWQEAKAILDKYQISYVYVGDLEIRTYPLDESKFQEHLQLVYDSPGARIYAYAAGQ